MYWDGCSLNTATEKDLKKMRAQAVGRLEEAVPGSGMVSRRDRKQWGHKQRRVAADLALNGATVAALLRIDRKELRSSRQRDED